MAEDVAGHSPDSCAAALSAWTQPEKQGVSLEDVRELDACVTRLGDGMNVERDGAEADCVTSLKKMLLQKIAALCSDTEVAEPRQLQDVPALLDMVSRVTERGYNSLLTEEAIEAICALHQLSCETCVGDSAEDWAAVASQCLHLLVNASPRHADAVPGVTRLAALSFGVVWKTFDAAWDHLAPAALADGVRIVQALRKHVPVADLPDVVQRSYFETLAMGVTLSHVSLSGTEAGKTPAAAQAASDLLLSFPPASAAFCCRAWLLEHLQNDVYHALYYLRLFLHTRHGQEAERHQQLQLLRCDVTPLEELANKDVCVVRGAVTALRYFMLPDEALKPGGKDEAPTSLSTKECLVVLSSLRQAIATGKVAVVSDVLLLILRLLESSAAAHLETHWHVVLNTVGDVIYFYYRHDAEGLNEPLFKTVQRLAAVVERMDLASDRERAVQLADSCVGTFEEFAPLPALRDLAKRVVAHRLDTADPERLRDVLTKYLLGRHDVFDANVKTECLRIFRSKPWRTHQAILECLLKIVTEPKTDQTFALAAGWTPPAASEVAGVMIEMLLGASDGIHFAPPLWEELVKVSRNVALHEPAGTALSAERRWDVFSAIVQASSHKLTLTTASYCPELWQALLKLLFHQQAKVRHHVLDYLLELRCNDDLEVSQSGVETHQAVSAVVREPLASLEAELPVAGILDAVISRIPIDAECFSKNLQVVRHFLTNNYFVIGNVAANCAPLVKLSQELLALAREESRVLSLLNQASVQEITATIAVLVPYCHSMPPAGREEAATNTLQCVAALLRKILEAWALLSPSADALVAALTEVFGCAHVALYQLLTAEDLERSAKLRESAGDVLLAVAAVAPRALAVAERIRGGGPREPAPSHGAAAPRAAPGPLVNEVKDSVSAGVGGASGAGASVHSAFHSTTTSAAQQPPPPLAESSPHSPALSDTTSTVASQNPPPAPMLSAPSSPTGHEAGEMPQLPPAVLPTAQTAASATKCKQCLVSLLTLVHSIVLSPLADDNLPGCRAPAEAVHGFSEALFKLLGELADTAQYEHRIHFLAHMVVAEVLQQNRQGLARKSSRYEFLKRLVFSAKARPSKFSKRQSAAAEEEEEDGKGRELLRATADLAWRTFHLGSIEANAQWDPLIEAFFSDGETQCWIANGPHAPCVVSTTTGRAQHMLVTMRSLTASVTWTCILHNKPSLPYDVRPYLPPAVVEASGAELCEDLREVPVRPVTVELMQQEHDEEMRGLLEGFSSIGAPDGSSQQGELKAPDAKTGLTQEGMQEALEEASGSSTASPQMKEVVESARLRASVSSLTDDEPCASGTVSRDSPVPSYDSPHKGGASTAEFAPIGAVVDRRDRHPSFSRGQGSASAGTRGDGGACSVDDTGSRPERPPPHYSSLDYAQQRSPTPALPRSLMTPVPSTSDAPSMRDVLANSVHGAFILSMFKMAGEPPKRLRWDDQLLRTLSALDRIPCRETHKYATPPSPALLGSMETLPVNDDKKTRHLSDIKSDDEKTLDYLIYH